MANPQVENGYVRIATELVEVVARVPLAGREINVLVFVVRKTYGYNKKTDYISLTQFEYGTGLDRRSVCRIIKRLVALKILTKNNSVYGLNKDYSSWLVAPRPLGGRGVQANLLGASTPHTIDNIQKTIDTFGKRAHLTAKKNNMPFRGYNENESQDEGPSIDADTGEMATVKKAGRDPIATRVSAYFFSHASKLVGRPLVNQGYGYVKKFTKQASESDLKAIADNFFDGEPSDPTNIYKCFNASAINKYLAEK